MIEWLRRKLAALPVIGRPFRRETAMLFFQTSDPLLTAESICRAATVLYGEDRVDGCEQVPDPNPSFGDGSKLFGLDIDGELYCIIFGNRPWVEGPTIDDTFEPHHAREIHKHSCFVRVSHKSPRFEANAESIVGQIAFGLMTRETCFVMCSSYIGIPDHETSQLFADGRWLKMMADFNAGDGGAEPVSIALK